jgi:hypothetical protein
MCSGWLGPSSATLATWATALFTLGAAIVAVYYVIATYRLALSAEAQAVAAKDQADTTQNMFKAAYRPYLEVRVPREGSSFTNEQTYYVPFHVKCHGQVPATVTHWRAVFFRLGDASDTELVTRESSEGYRYGIFPDQESPPCLLQGPRPGPPPAHHPRVNLRVTVSYIDVTGAAHESYAVVRSTESERWTLLEQGFT